MGVVATSLQISQDDQPGNLDPRTYAPQDRSQHLDEGRNCFMWEPTYLPLSFEAYQKYKESRTTILQLKD